MIVEKLPQHHYQSNNFKYLAAYVLRVPEVNLKRDPLDWGLTVDRQTEAVAWAKTVNSVDDNLGWAIKEADLVQRTNKRVETCKSCHYVISFPAGESPSREVLENIEQVLSTAIGYREHQRLMAVHRDKPHLHMHVVINRIHPQTFRAASVRNDHRVLGQTAAELEAVHGLTKTNHTPGTRTRQRQTHQPAWQIAPPPAKRDPLIRAAFRQAKDEASRARQEALAALRAKQKKYEREQKLWHASRRQAARAIKMSRPERKASNLALREAAQNDLAARKQRETWEHNAVRQQFPLLTYAMFVKQREAIAHQQIQRSTPERSRSASLGR